jgi:hypothetical protein
MSPRGGSSLSVCEWIFGERPLEATVEAVTFQLLDHLRELVGHPRRSALAGAQHL